MNWDILLKYINKECDVAEAKQVEAWLGQQEDNRYLFNYLKKRREQLQQPLAKDDIHTQWVLLLDRIFETQNKIAPAKSKPGLWFMGIAASLFLFGLLGWFYNSLSKSNVADRVITYQTPGNSSGKLILPDSSLVYMAPNSKLSYTTVYGAKTRELHLTGEAFFNVKHNTKSPFVIYTQKNLSVTVLGTSFNIYSKNNAYTEVKVATGLVGVTAGKQTCFLKAGQQLNYRFDQQKSNITSVEQNDAAALQNQTLYFKNNNVDGIAQKLHRWYNIDVEVLPAANKHSRFSGEMKDTGIDNLLKGLGYATGLKYKHKNAHTIQLF